MQETGKLAEGQVPWENPGNRQAEYRDTTGLWRQRPDDGILHDKLRIQTHKGLIREELGRWNTPRQAKDTNT